MKKLIKLCIIVGIVAGLVATAHARPFIGDGPVFFQSEGVPNTFMVFPHASHDFCITCHSLPEIKGPTECSLCHLDKEMVQRYIQHFQEAERKFLENEKKIEKQKLLEKQKLERQM